MGSSGDGRSQWIRDVLETVLTRPADKLAAGVKFTPSLETLTKGKTRRGAPALLVGVSGKNTGLFWNCYGREP